MKNVKKLLALGLAAAMSLSLVACGGGSDTDTNATGGAADSGARKLDPLNLGSSVCWRRYVRVLLCSYGRS